MKKISFDFDSTLDTEYIQKYAHELMLQGYDIHIVTSRPENWAQSWTLSGNKYILWNNNDLREVAKSLGIKDENIHFTGYDNKYKFFENEDFIFHLDDDWSEIDEINSFTKTKGILFDNNWEENCNELLKS